MKKYLTMLVVTPLILLADGPLVDQALKTDNVSGGYTLAVTFLSLSVLALGGYIYHLKGIIKEKDLDLKELNADQKLISENAITSIVTFQAFLENFKQWMLNDKEMSKEYRMRAESLRHDIHESLVSIKEIIVKNSK